jgi:hypothetical protein
MKSWLFWILWGFDALVALGFLYFFFIGLADGSVSSFNITLWMGILGFFWALMGGTLWLKLAGHPVIGACILLVPAVIAFLFLLFFLVVLISNPRWN